MLDNYTTTGNLTVETTTAVTGVGGKSVRQENVSGGTHFPRKFCPTGQDILSTLGQIIRVCF